ncbi:hypothetical protein RB2150_08764 [Rhodobacterales bacterium HTCC2150]|nr:hypothetical protein RB2150_08764 [Rhodobacterales bacterium HTCC2150] [Rhodobacteraceae bacterium HTCC2150]
MAPLDTLTADQENAAALVGSIKIAQKATLANLNKAAKEARLAKDIELTKKLKDLAITLSRQNLVLHRAKQKALRRENLKAVNQELMKIVAETNASITRVQNTIELLEQAAKLLDLIRRTVDVFT